MGGGVDDDGGGDDSGSVDDIGGGNCAHTFLWGKQETTIMALDSEDAYNSVSFAKVISCLVDFKVICD